MDIISKAIRKGQHLCEKIRADKQTWDFFEKNRIGKKIYVLGAGNGMGYFIRNCREYIEIAGVLDNEAGKQGKRLEEICIDAVDTIYEGIVVDAPSVLKRYESNEIVVLITAINEYLSMAEQLEQLGIKNYYILLMMEADRRKRLGKAAQEDYFLKYVDWCYKQKIDNKKIIMLIEPYGEHAIQITRKLLNQNNKLDIVWIVNDLRVEKPAGVRLILQANRKRFIYEMTTAKIWLFDDIVPQFITKREGQIYIQVKHWSSITLKKFYLDDNDNHKSKKIETAIKSDGERMDYLLSGSEFDEKTCRSGFGFKGKAIRLGSPRSDLLFDDMVKTRVHRYFEIDGEAHICLYVPTYRNRQLDSGYAVSISLDVDRLLKTLCLKWQGEWFLFVRLHPGLQCGDSISVNSRHVVNVSDYLNSEELVAAADIMITDYSSIMFEGAYVKKPVFLYAPDRKEYIDHERSLLIEYDTLPFAISESNQELQKAILHFEQNSYEKGLDSFLSEYGVCEDGHASERAASFIIELLERN